MPPLVIYKQAPRPPTPPPLIIRERPPTPIDVPKEPLIIERRVPVPERHRKVIIEHLPPPPPKPRDIILEKWLPREPAPRSVFVQKTNQVCHQKQIYDIVDKNVNQKSDHRCRKDLEIMSKEHKKSRSLTRRSNSNEPIYAKNQVYSKSAKQVPKIAGYRIIRQIIPGPSSTPSDIEKAIARSQRVSCTMYSNHQQIHGRCYDNRPVYQTSQRNCHSHLYSCPNKFASPSIYSPGSGCYSVINYKPHPNARQVVVQHNYSPHNNLFNKGERNYVRREIYRSSSFDRF